MLITLPLRAAICKSVAEVLLTGAAPLGTVSHRFNLFKYNNNNNNNNNKVRLLENPCELGRNLLVSSVIDLLIFILTKEVTFICVTL